MVNEWRLWTSSHTLALKLHQIASCYSADDICQHTGLAYTSMGKLDRVWNSGHLESYCQTPNIQLLYIGYGMIRRLGHTLAIYAVYIAYWEYLGLIIPRMLKY